MIDTLIEHLPKDGVLTKFSTPKGLHKTYDVEVSPFNLTLCLRGTSSDLCHQAQTFEWLRSGGCSKPPLARAVEEAFIATPMCDWKNNGGRNQWKRG